SSGDARGAEDPLSPGRPKGAILFLVRVRAGLEPTSRVVTSAVRPFAIATALADVPRNATRLHLERGGAWRFRTGLAAPGVTGTGRPTISDGEVLVTFDPELTAHELLPILAGLGGRRSKVFLGAADAATFDPPPPTKWRPRVHVDIADGVDHASAEL